MENLQSQLDVERVANQRLQQRLAEFKRTNTGYSCQCQFYEHLIAIADKDNKALKGELAKALADLDNLRQHMRQLYPNQSMI